LSVAHLLNPSPPELARRSHLQARVWVDLVEVFEGRRELCQCLRRIGEIHLALVSRPLDTGSSGSSRALRRPDAPGQFLSLIDGRFAVLRQAVKAVQSAVER